MLLCPHPVVYEVLSNDAIHPSVPLFVYLSVTVSLMPLAEKRCIYGYGYYRRLMGNPMLQVEPALVSLAV